MILSRGMYNPPNAAGFTSGSSSRRRSRETYSTSYTWFIKALCLIAGSDAACSSVTAGRIAPTRRNGMSSSWVRTGYMGFAATTSCDSSEPGDASYPVWMIALLEREASPPMSRLFSTTATLSSYFDSSRATAEPTAPAPMTMTLNFAIFIPPDGMLTEFFFFRGFCYPRV